MNNIIIFIGLFFVLWIGRSIFIPLLIATFLWYLINAIASYYRKVLPFKHIINFKHCFWVNFFNMTSVLLSVLTLFGIIYLFITQVNPMFSELVNSLPEIQQRLVNLLNYISLQTGLKLDSNILPSFTTIAANIGASAANIATSIGMIFIYMIFLFVEQSTFNKKLDNLFTNKHKTQKANYIIESVDKNMKQYLFMKTFISGATGICAYIWLKMIGLEFAGVWAFVMFIMNYIPTIGSFIACGLPILYAMITHDTIQIPLLTAGGLIGLEIIFGNILDPKLMGKTLNLSTLAILINLVFWGLIWGVAGMFFSVPILTAIYIITAQFDSTRWIAVLLSADGNIPDKKED
ncbi:MAG: AI-2E family transporter [Alphaproteobacteria bacterium]